MWAIYLGEGLLNHNMYYDEGIISQISNNNSEFFVFPSRLLYNILSFNIIYVL
jgi:hypothetical protein